MFTDEDTIINTNDAEGTVKILNIKLDHDNEVVKTFFRGFCLATFTLFLMAGFIYTVAQRDLELMDKLLPVVTALLGYITGRSTKS